MVTPDLPDVCPQLSGHQTFETFNTSANVTSLVRYEVLATVQLKTARDQLIFKNFNFRTMILFSTRSPVFLNV